MRTTLKALAAFLAAFIINFASIASAKECEVAISSKPGFVEPGPGVPAEYSKFYGTWGYGWTGFNCGLIAMTRVSAKGEVSIIFGWGKTTQAPAGFRRMEGKIEGNKIFAKTDKFNLSITYGETGVGYSQGGSHLWAIIQSKQSGGWGDNPSGLSRMEYPLHPELASRSDECEVAVPSRYQQPKVNPNEVNRNFVDFLGPWKTGRANGQGRCSRVIVESMDVRGQTHTIFSMGLTKEGPAFFERAIGTISTNTLSTMVTGIPVTFSIQPNLSLVGNVESPKGWYSTVYERRMPVQVSSAN